MSNIVDTPLLIIAFNRPDTTQKVIEALSKVKPNCIYAAIDAPRPSKGEEEKRKNKEVLELIKGIDWDCKIDFIQPHTNLGCKLNISQAISYIFEKEEKLLVIEDDIVAAPTFFTFAEEMLEKYKTESKVGIVTANNYTPVPSDTDYYFSKFTHIWGWALWKRTWDGFDVDLNFLKDKDVFMTIDNMNTSLAEKKYMKNYFLNVKHKIDTNIMNAWGPQFFLYNYLNGFLTITPKSNLAMNIGVESSRSSAKGQIDVHYRPVDDKFRVTKHPNEIRINKEYDDFHFKKHINYKPTLKQRISNKLKRILS